MHAGVPPAPGAAGMARRGTHVGLRGAGGQRRGPGLLYAALWVAAGSAAHLACDCTI